jgi:glycosyltransferase involved in cell wall biosynthesis
MRIGIEASNMLAEFLTGVEYSLVQLVRHLPRADNRNEYVLYFNFIRPEYAARFETRVRPLLSERIDARICRVPNRLLQLARGWTRWPIERTLGPCAAVLYPAFDMHAQRRGARVATIHDLMPLTHADQYSGRDVADFRRSVPRIAREADALIAVSQHTKEMIVERLSVAPERIVVVHHGVDETFCPAPAAAVTELRRKLGLVRPYILFVGTAEPRKNLLRLIDAFALLRRDVLQEFDLVLAGKAAWGSQRIRERIAAHALESQVFLPGHIGSADLPALYTGAAVFVLPSLAEGFGMPLLEAMACGVPVVASNTTALPEVYGDAALGFDPTSTEALTNALEHVLGDTSLRADLVARGFRRASHFSWEDSARKTRDVLEAVA